MPKYADRIPSYRRHKATGQAVVTLAGQEIYLGKWNTAASRREYDRLIGEWLAAGRCLPRTEHDLSIVELAAAYWRRCQGYYRKNGQPTRSLERIRMALRLLKKTYADTAAVDFGPLALQALQARFVQEGKARPYVNVLIAEIRRCFRWGVSQELVPPTVFQALATVPGLRRGALTLPSRTR